MKILILGPNGLLRIAIIKALKRLLRAQELKVSIETAEPSEVDQIVKWFDKSVIVKKNTQASELHNIVICLYSWVDTRPVRISDKTLRKSDVIIWVENTSGFLCNRYMRVESHEYKPFFEQPTEKLRLYSAGGLYIALFQLLEIVRTFSEFSPLSDKMEVILTKGPRRDSAYCHYISSLIKTNCKICLKVKCEKPSSFELVSQEEGCRIIFHVSKSSDQTILKNRFRNHFSASSTQFTLEPPIGGVQDYSDIFVKFPKEQPSFAHFEFSMRYSPHDVTSLFVSNIVDRIIQARNH